MYRFPVSIQLIVCLFSVSMGTSDFIVWCFSRPYSGDMYSLLCVLTVLGIIVYQWTKFSMEYLAALLSFGIKFTLFAQGKKVSKSVLGDSNQCVDGSKDVAALEKKEKRRKRRARLDNSDDAPAAANDSKKDNDANDNADVKKDVKITESRNGKSKNARRNMDEVKEEINKNYSRSSIKPITLKDFFTATALPEVPPSPKKNGRRQRKKRNTNKAKFKLMDDSSDTSSTSDLSIKSCYTPPEKTTVYSPLPAYQTLNLDMSALYREFRHYLLTEEQLRANCFPEERPDRPGRILTVDGAGRTDPGERRCARCSGTFKIGPDGSYKSDNGACRYHARKQLPYRRGHPYKGDYPCCNGDYMSEGCVTWQYHVTAESSLGDVEFVRTKSKKHLKKNQNCVYGLDCEMLYTTAGLEVAKVGVVSAEGLTVFESFVLPQSQILDYNTAYSGITERDLKGVTMTLGDVQAYLLKLLSEDSILVGHGLENDLRALRLVHRKVVDTSVVFPHERSPRYKKSLKNLAMEFLNKQIQTSSSGHNCIEDARTCMDLMLLRISLDLKDRPVPPQDENRNSILQNSSATLPPAPVSQQQQEFVPAKYVYDSWQYGYSSYCSNSYRGENFYSGFLMPKNYQNSCIY